ncbi:MAG TPA: hypothetical protein VKV80_04420 [Streptosporangiaceae bacterium]|nr:hypothetical protein [Streptosporangiaceae bacterium]
MATSRGSTTSRSRGTGGSSPGRLPPVRLASRNELAAAARVVPLLRSARDLAAWAGGCAPGRASGEGGELTPAAAAAAGAALDLPPEEVRTAWAIATSTGMVPPGDREPRRGGTDVLDAGDEEILGLWAAALRAVLASGHLDGLATALYTAGGPVGIDALFEAYAASAGALPPGDAGGAGAVGGRASAGGGADGAAAALSQALETLADLGVVEMGADEETAGLTVSLSPLGVWGMQDRLRERGWQVPVLGSSAAGDAAAVLAVLADYNADDGEQEIAAWLARRSPQQAAAELIEAASTGSPGMRGAAFAVLDRVGEAAVPAVRDAVAVPVLRPHAAVWLREHGEHAELSREDSAWLLVDLGAGLLEEADPADVVADLLPDLPPHAQADLVAGLWKVDHPSVTGLLTTLSDYHPDPEVAKAARKAAFKARSRT